ncbi:unnamed protein product [Amoebophrya sp. A25]|nr:unnamed protein product [Amoebophrya sp. A25]|eukprot:GSA25T00013566001.1
MNTYTEALRVRDMRQSRGTDVSHHEVTSIHSKMINLFISDREDIAVTWSCGCAIFPFLPAHRIFEFCHLSDILVRLLDAVLLHD